MNKNKLSKKHIRAVQTLIEKYKGANIEGYNKYKDDYFYILKEDKHGCILCESTHTKLHPSRNCSKCIYEGNYNCLNIWEHLYYRIKESVGKECIKLIRKRGRLLAKLLEERLNNDSK